MAARRGVIPAGAGLRRIPIPRAASRRVWKTARSARGRANQAAITRKENDTMKMQYSVVDMADVINRSSRLVEDVHGSGVYPAGYPSAPGDAVVRSSAALGHPEAREGADRRIPDAETAALLAGRAIFGGFFLYNGINHFVNRGALVEYARSKGVPAPEAAVAASGLMLLAGGASILTGVRPKMGACLISTFLSGVSPVMHAFWRSAERPQSGDGELHEERSPDRRMLIAAAHAEPWPWQVEPSEPRPGANARVTSAARKKRRS